MPKFKRFLKRNSPFKFRVTIYSAKMQVVFDPSIVEVINAKIQVVFRGRISPTVTS